METEKVQLSNGQIAIVPKGMSDEEIRRRYKEKMRPQFEKDAEAIKNTSPVDLIWGSAPGRFVAGTADLGMGGLQLGAHALGLKGPSEYMDRAIQENEAARRRGDLAYGREGFDWMRLMGNAMNPALLKAGAVMPTATLGQKVFTGTAMGAGAGLLSPVEGQSGYWGTKAWQTGIGGLLGGLLPLGMEAIKWGGKVGKHLLEPLGKKGQTAIRSREYLTAAGDKIDDIIDLLSKNKKFVPGSNPTAAEAASPAGRAEFAAMQKAAARHRPSEYLARTREQDAARSTSIGEIAKDAKTLASAEGARDARGAANYGEAWAKSLRLKGDDELVGIASSPYFDTAYRDALKIAQTENIPTNSGHFVHLVKRGLDKQLEKISGDKALGGEERRAVQGLKTRLTNWLENKVPEYKTAREQFAKDSGVINRMKVGKELLDTLNQPISDWDTVGAQRAGPFARAVKESSKIIKDSGGNPRFGEIKDILTKDEMSRVNGVVDDLARRMRYDEQAKAGLRSAKGNIVSAQLERETGAANAPNALHRPIMIFNAILKRIQGKAGEKVEQDIADEMLDPQAVAMVMKRAMIPKQKAEKILKILGPNPIGYSSLSGATATEAAKDTDKAKRRLMNAADLASFGLLGP